MSFMRNFNGKRLAVTLLLVCCVVGGVAYYVYDRDVATPEAESSNRQRDTFYKMMKGLAEKTPNHLDARFTDASGSGIADPPAASKCVDPARLTFSYVATEDPEHYQKIFAPLVEYLSQQTGKPCDYVPLKSTDEEVAALSDGRLVVAAFNTGAVPVAVNKGGLIPVCMMPAPSGASKMDIIVPADSPIQTPADLKGSDLTLTDPSSNSGCKAAIVVLKNKFNLEPVRDYNIVYSGGQEQSLIGLTKPGDQRYKAVAVASDYRERMVAKGDLKPTQFRVIYSSDAFPTACLGYAYNLNPDLAAKVRQALLKFDLANTSIKGEFGISAVTKFLPVNYKQDWSTIRDVDDQIVKMGQPASVSPG
jgi:phosphonate transport system substrate-binding protein